MSQAPKAHLLLLPDSSAASRRVQFCRCQAELTRCPTEPAPASPRLAPPHPRLPTGVAWVPQHGDAPPRYPAHALHRPGPPCCACRSRGGRAAGSARACGGACGGGAGGGALKPQPPLARLCCRRCSRRGRRATPPAAVRSRGCRCQAGMRRQRRRRRQGGRRPVPGHPHCCFKRGRHRSLRSHSQQRGAAAKRGHLRQRAASGTWRQERRSQPSASPAAQALERCQTLLPVAATAAWVEVQRSRQVAALSLGAAPKPAACSSGSSCKEGLDRGGVRGELELAGPPGSANAFLEIKTLRQKVRWGCRQRLAGGRAAPLPGLQGAIAACCA